MFYAHFVLSKKGPLARIWLAAHWDKKLTKAHVFETNVESSVEAILQPKVKMALRTSGHLLLGVVRIYSRKAKYLLADCNEAFVKIKMAFRPGVVDLPEDNREAAVAAITLPETFHDFDTTMADLNDIDVQAQFTVNQSRPEEITMREDLGNITLVGDDGFGDMGFDEGEVLRDDMQDSLYKNAEASNLMIDGDLSKEKDNEKMDIDLNAPVKDDGFGDAGIDGGMFDGGDAGDIPDDDSDDDNNDFGGGMDHELFGENFMDGGGLFEEAPMGEVPLPADTTGQPPVTDKEDLWPITGGDEKEVAPPILQPEEEEPVAPTEPPPQPDQTTLVHNEEEAFALEPLDVTSVPGQERKAKRKRKLIVDEAKGIASETMKLQLSDTSDIITTLDLAPPTKKLMHWKETGGVEKLFALPGRPHLSKRVARLFSRNLITKPMDDEIVQEEENLLDLEGPEIQRDEVNQTATHIEDASVVEPPAAAMEDTSTHDVSRRSTRSEKSLLEVPQTPAAAAPEAVPETPVPAPVSVPEPELAPQTPRVQRDDDDDEVYIDPRTPAADLAGDQELSGEHENFQFEDDNELMPEGATEEQQEEFRTNKRSQQMIFALARPLERSPNINFNDMISHNNRKQAASKFYTLLVLKKQQAIELTQTEPFADLIISKGPTFGLAY